MSHAHLPAQLVIDACESYLKARKERIAQQSEEEIAKWVGYKFFFWSRPMSRERAEEFCATELQYIRITGGRWAQEVKQLLTLAKISKECNTFVTVSADMAECLKAHFG